MKQFQNKVEINVLSALLEPSIWRNRIHLPDTLTLLTSLMTYPFNSKPIHVCCISHKKFYSRNASHLDFFLEWHPPHHFITPADSCFLGAAPRCKLEASADDLSLSRWMHQQKYSHPKVHTEDTTSGDTVSIAGIVFQKLTTRKSEQKTPTLAVPH